VSLDELLHDFDGPVDLPVGQVEVRQGNHNVNGAVTAVPHFQVAVEGLVVFLVPEADQGQFFVAGDQGNTDCNRENDQCAEKDQDEGSHDEFPPSRTSTSSARPLPYPISIVRTPESPDEKTAGCTSPFSSVVVTV